MIVSTCTEVGLINNLSKINTILLHPDGDVALSKLGYYEQGKNETSGGISLFCDASDGIRGVYNRGTDSEFEDRLLEERQKQGVKTPSTYSVSMNEDDVCTAGISTYDNETDQNMSSFKLHQTLQRDWWKASNTTEPHLKSIHRKVINMLPKCIWSIEIIRILFRLMSKNLNVIDQRQGDRCILKHACIDNKFQDSIKTSIEEFLSKECKRIEEKKWIMWSTNDDVIAGYYWYPRKMLVMDTLLTFKPLSYVIEKRLGKYTTEQKSHEQIKLEKAMAKVMNYSVVFFSRQYLTNKGKGEGSGQFCHSSDLKPEQILTPLIENGLLIGGNFLKDYAMYYCDHHRMKCNEEQSTYSKLSDEELKRYLVYLKHLNREESQCNVGRSDIEERFEQKKKSMGFIASFLNCGIIVGFSDSVNHEGPRKITDHLLTMMKLGGKLPSLLVYDAACQLHKFWMYRFGGEHMKNTAYTQELMNMILVCDRFHNTVHKGDLCKTVFNPDSEQNRKEYSQYCLTLNEHDMNKIYSLLKSIIFEYNKSKCIKRITDDLFADAISNLENLLNANVDDLCQKITYNKSKKSSADYYYLKEKSRHAIKNNKNNVELKIILEFQVTGELLYDSEIFCSMLSKVYSIDNDAERILYYLDKVSAHQRSLNLILKTLHKRKSEYACRLGNDETKKEFQDRFIENKFVEYDLSLKLSTCLHSEIRMIDYLIEQNIKEVHDNDVEIGISKLPCYLCSLYI
ncbi:unnamed protein product [Rotaria sp. Silwood1]|nr:unnamed protein product [Rotaria sp. Silwood1]